MAFIDKINPDVPEALIISFDRNFCRTHMGQRIKQIPIDGVNGAPANHCAARKNCKLLITRDMQNCNLLGETKLVPPSKGKNANYMSIKHLYLRVVRGDSIERMGDSSNSIITHTACTLLSYVNS